MEMLVHGLKYSLSRKMTDFINSPPHYTHGPIEVIDLIELFNLDYNEGNALKYLLRWRHKGGVEDLHKAEWYIKRIIKASEEGPGSTAPGGLKEELSRARGLGGEDPGSDLFIAYPERPSDLRGTDEDRSSEAGLAGGIS